MYEKPPSEEELAAFGLTLDDYETIIEIWPENWEAVKLFDFLGTQWRVGANGATGLDYNILYHKMDRMGLSAEEFERMEGDIRAMELVALKAMRG